LPDELRIGVIGAGRMGTFHVRAWNRVDGASVAAVADPDAAARARALDGLPPAVEYDDWSRLLARSEQLDAVSIACPSELHCDVALAALAAGLHVLVEKPLAISLPEALRLRGAARESGRKLMVGHVERFNPVVAALRDALDRQLIGRIFRAHATRVGPLPARIRDAGVAIDVATHDLDVIQYILGRQAVEVYAEGGRFAHPSQEDLLTCLARFDAEGSEEVLGLLDVNWLTPEPRRELTLIGEAGLLRADYVAQEVVLVEGAGAAPRPLDIGRAEPLLAELNAFARCIRLDTPVPVSAHDGVRALAAALAVRESAATRRPVALLDIPAPAPRLLKAV
jgi:UDP-N-acetylglucosamine 3-dehydrogenase